jgi:hypothetical protein
MRILNVGQLLVAACCLLSTVCLAQARENDAAGPMKASASSAAAPSSAAPTVQAPAPFATSAIVGSSLAMVQQTLDSVRVEKWKRGSVRDEAAGDLNTIQREMKENLPPLMKEADAGQGSLSKVLPVSTHVDALYDVLLRVLEAARIAAPDDQASAIRQALNSLGSARLALDDHILQRATAQEKQVTDLHTVVEKQAAFKCPAPPATPVCTPPPAKKKKPSKPKPTTPATGSEPGTSTKPPASPTTPQKTGP